MRAAALRLGELLEQRGQITRDQLLRALRNQKVVGGRLGTCLLEIEALTEEQLCSALAEQQGVPCASPEDLRGIPDDVLEMLPAKVARRCRAIAFQASTTQVKVALIDARDLAAQDEISFVVGRRIRWYVALELRLMEALEKHHGEECPPRMAKLLDKMNRSRFLWAREASTAAAPEEAAKRKGDQLQWDSRIAGVASAGASPGGLPGAVDGPAAVSSELPHFQHQTLDLPIVAPPVASTAPSAPVDSGAPRAADSRAAAPEPTPAPSSAPPAPAKPAAPPRPPKAHKSAGTAPPPASPAVAAPPLPSPPAPAAPASPPPTTPPVAPAPEPPAAPTAVPRRWSVGETEKRLLQTRERDDVARAVLDFAAGLAARAVLFVVRKDEVASWLWSGDGIDGARLSAFRLKLDQPSLFAGLREAGAYFRGPLPPLPSNLGLSACFAAPAFAGELILLPVKVKERLVAALLLEPPPASGEEPSAGDLADLQRVIAKAEIAFELCIMQSKLRKA